MVLRPDEFGNIASGLFYITVDTMPPKIVILDPENLDGYRTNLSVIDVIYKVDET